MQVWFKLDDHKASIVEEDVVMKEALGDSEGYKSACNLFYINQHIVDNINKAKNPVFTKEFGERVAISSDIHKQIKMNNCEFEIEC